MKLRTAATKISNQGISRNIAEKCNNDSQSSSLNPKTGVRIYPKNGRVFALWVKN